MNSLRFKEMFYVDYSLAYTIIKEYGLTSQDKGKIEGMKMDHGVKDAIYKILNIAWFIIKLWLWKYANIYI